MVSRLYGLYEDERLRYIGYTSRTVEIRYGEHIKAGLRNLHPHIKRDLVVNYWLGSMARRGLTPGVRELLVCEDSEWEFYERALIFAARERDPEGMLNTGDGGWNGQLAAKHLRDLTEAGRLRHADTLRKTRESLKAKGYYQTDEYRDRCRRQAEKANETIRKSKPEGYSARIYATCSCGLDRHITYLNRVHVASMGHKIASTWMQLPNDCLKLNKNNLPCVGLVVNNFCEVHR